MKATEIKQIIKRANTNEDIKWYVKVNTTSKLILTNGYDTCVKYGIYLEDFGGEVIIAKDEHMDETVCILTVGDKIYDDCKTVVKAKELAIEACVRHFNYYY